MLNIIYRISNAGYNKVKPDYINNENCLNNALFTFNKANWNIIADNIKWLKINNFKYENTN
jgi:hypothetical protein